MNRSMKLAVEYLRHALVAIPFLVLASCSKPVPQNPDETAAIAPQDIRYHVDYLASDELEGRGTGTRGEQAAGRYIEHEFRRYGLRAAGTTGYFQPFEFVSAVRMGPENELTVKLEGRMTRFEPNKDFRPLSFSANGVVMGDVVFVGYGIEADSLGYNDYDGIDAQGKIALMLRYGPDGDDPHSAFDAYTPLIRKTSTAVDKGAAAVLFVTGPTDQPEDELIPLKLQRLAGAAVPVGSISRLATDSILSAAATSIAEEQTTINAGRKPHSFDLPGVEVTFTSDVRKIESVGRNVLAFLRGNDPVLQQQVVVIGAHYDHLGFGGENSLAGADTREIHNGADDNASGTAALLELAARFAAAKDSVKRSLLFAAFSGEELGLLGSGHYVRKPVIPLEQTVAMLNLDMVGRLKDSSLVVMGEGSSPIWKEILDQTATGRPFQLKRTQGGTGPSDHASFYLKDIPVLFFFTGQHEDYHKPSDDPEKINVEGEAEVTRFVFDIAMRLVSRPRRPQFTKVEEPEQRSGRRGFRVYVGTIPDYAAEGVSGMKISGVSSGSPAEESGLQPGDVIVRFGEKDVRNIYDYMYALGDHKAGERVPVTVLRDERRVQLWVTLRKR